MVKLDTILDEHGEMSHDDYREWLKARGIVTMPGQMTFMRYIERLEEQVKPITWTTEKPTTPGYWWWRKLPDRYGEVMHLHPSNFGDAPTLPDVLGGEWAGPIEKPL